MHTHEDRDRHLFGPGPKRILSLDGGGIRGLITLGMLARVEELLRNRQPPEKQASFVLSDYFDLIAGTSTGSIIATWLALGNSVASAQSLYDEVGPTVFSQPRLAGQFFWSKFDHAALESILEDRLSTLTLNSVALKTGLLITCKRVDTGSAWILSNNPKAPYWKYDQFRPLNRLVRASTAAPSFFAPARLDIGNGDTGLFLDGAMGGQNNPSLAAFIHSTAVELGISWPTGDQNLYILSLGTGYHRPAQDTKRFLGKIAAQQAVDVLQALIHETSITAVTMLQAVSTPTQPFQINTEIGGLEKTLLSGSNLLSFERFDPPISGEGLTQGLGLPYTDGQIRNLLRMDNAQKANRARLTEIGKAAGAQIAEAALPKAFDI